MRYGEYKATTDVCVALATCPDEAVAGRLAQTLVERGIAACVTSLPGATSVYRWQGKIEASSEVQLFIKTTRARLVELTAVLADIHPYDEPEILVLDAGGGSRGYLSWIEETTKESG